MTKYKSLSSSFFDKDALGFFLMYEIYLFVLIIKKIAGENRIPNPIRSDVTETIDTYNLSEKHGVYSIIITLFYSLSILTISLSLLKY